MLQPVDGNCVVLKISGDLVTFDQWCYVCVLFIFRGFSTWNLLFLYDIIISFSHLLLKEANSFWKHILIFLSASKIISFFISSISILSNLQKVLEVSSIMSKSGVGPLVVCSVWLMIYEFIIWSFTFFSPLFSSSEALFASSDFDIFMMKLVLSSKFVLSFLSSLDIFYNKALSTIIFWTQ